MGLISKLSGLGWTTLSVADAGATARDIRNDVTNLQISTPRAVWDVTGIDKSAFERLLLLADFQLDLSFIFNDTALTGSHAVFSTVPSTSVARTCTLTVNGKSLGVTPATTLLFTDYQLTRTQSGELNGKTTGMLANGLVPTWT